MTPCAASPSAAAEIAVTFRALFWPGTVLALALLFRTPLAAMLARANAVSITTPAGGVTIAARVAGLLEAAAARRSEGAGVAAPRAGGSASGGGGDRVVWVGGPKADGPTADGVPADGAPERQALAEAGRLVVAADETSLERVLGAAPVDGRAVDIVLAGRSADPALASRLLTRYGRLRVVLYPDPGQALAGAVPAGAVVCRDPLSLFVALTARAG